MTLQVLGVEMKHRGRGLCGAPGATQRDDAGGAVLGPDAPGSQPAHVVELDAAPGDPEIQPVGHRQGYFPEGRGGFALAGKADPAGTEHVGHIVGHAVIGAEAQESMRFDPAQFDPCRPCRVTAADGETGPLQREAARKALLAGILFLPQAAPLDRLQMLRCLGKRVHDIVAPGRDFILYPAGMDEGVAGQETVEPVGVDACIVAQILGQAAVNAQGDVVFLRVRQPVPIAVGHEAVADGEPVVAVGDGFTGRGVDCPDQVPGRGNGEHIHRRCIAELGIAPRDIGIQVQLGMVAERMVEVQYRALLRVAGRVPPDVAVGKPATLVTRSDAGRVAEAGNITFRRVALPQRHRPYWIVAPYKFVFVVPFQRDDENGVAGDADILGLAESAALNPGGAAVPPAASGNFLAVEDIHPEGHASSLAERAAPEDAALQAVAAAPARQPRDHARLEAIQVLPEHDIERAARGGAADGAQAVGAENLDALHRREGQGFQIAAGAGVRPAIHQDEQRLPPGEEVADDAGVQQLLERLGARTLDEIPVVRGDHTRRRRERAGLRRARHQQRQHGKRCQKRLHRWCLTHESVLHPARSTVLYQRRCCKASWAPRSRIK
ncbi:MAG: hypothetical protein OXK20_01960 [Deltaproteobacteria bacterium]|nr:hypothetical protein [Deltaproteobacteria bacterium]